MSLNGGYAMIKYNSTQEELQIAYRSKKPVLFYDENQKAHWAVIEETSTESVDEETQEPITIYEYSYRLLNAVVANPTLSGDEATLNGLEVDGTKYKVGGTITLDDIINGDGNNRFMLNYGIWSSVQGMQGLQARWSLNGYNLMFEALGTFQTNVNPDTNIVSFKLPKWILNRIITPLLDVVDIFRFSIVNENGEISSATLMVTKTSDRIIFNASEGVTFTQPVVFRIRYNLIIE